MHPSEVYNENGQNMEKLEVSIQDAFASVSVKFSICV